MTRKTSYCYIKHLSVLQIQENNIDMTTSGWLASFLRFTYDFEKAFQFITGKTSTEGCQTQNTNTYTWMYLLL